MNRCRHSLRALILVGAVVIAVYPVLWMAGTALRTRPDIRANIWAPPLRPTLEHLRDVVTDGDFMRAFGNSFAVTATAVGTLTLLGSMAGYAFGCYDWRGKRWLWLAFMGGLILPIHVTLIPLVRLEVVLGLSRGWGSLAFLAAVYVAFNMSFTVFFLRGFFADVPQALVDAARLDGCGNWALYWRVMLPLSAPALAVVALVNTVLVWNELIFALVLIRSPELYTLPVAVMSFSDETGTDKALTCAALTVAVLPVIGLFVLGQRRLIRGMIAGALRG